MEAASCKSARRVKMRNDGSAYHDASDAIDIELYAVTESPGFGMDTMKDRTTLALYPACDVVCDNGSLAWICETDRVLYA